MCALSHSPFLGGLALLGDAYVMGVGCGTGGIGGTAIRRIYSESTHESAAGRMMGSRARAEPGDCGRARAEPVEMEQKRAGAEPTWAERVGA